ncbi:hypothetical protein C1646_731405 [Rhizophagus diaphanus]|nr:hypothetical protein C1646_731405 [Rhizophagus diaphanus] [Rhizophagus sp. MUCL 43196]
MTKMGKSKAFQVAIEELSKQQNENGLNAFRPSSIPTSSVTSTTTVSSTKNHKCIPENLDLDCVFNPKYTVTELISTRRKPRKQVVPPRPPNSYFLFKNCYMLELRKLGYRYAMPDICRQSKQLWTNISAEVKERYDILALQAVILHQEMYPGYRFQPKKKTIFKSHVFSENSVIVDTSMLNTFSVTNFLGDTTNNDDNNETIENSTNLLNSNNNNSTEQEITPQILSPQLIPSPPQLASPSPQLLSPGSSSLSSYSSSSSSPMPEFVDSPNLYPQCVPEASNDLSSTFNNPLDLLIYLDNYNNYGYPEFIPYEDNQNAIDTQHFLL